MFKLKKISESTTDPTEIDTVAKATKNAYLAIAFFVRIEPDKIFRLDEQTR